MVWLQPHTFTSMVLWYGILQSTQHGASMSVAAATVWQDQKGPLIAALT